MNDESLLIAHFVLVSLISKRECTWFACENSRNDPIAVCKRAICKFELVFEAFCTLCATQRKNNNNNDEPKRKMSTHPFILQNRTKKKIVTLEIKMSAERAKVESAISNKIKWWHWQRRRRWWWWSLSQLNLKCFIYALTFCYAVMMLWWCWFALHVAHFVCLCLCVCVTICSIFYENSLCLVAVVQWPCFKVVWRKKKKQRPENAEYINKQVNNFPPSMYDEAVSHRPSTILWGWNFFAYEPYAVVGICVCAAVFFFSFLFWLSTLKHHLLPCCHAHLFTFIAIRF